MTSDALAPRAASSPQPSIPRASDRSREAERRSFAEIRRDTHRLCSDFAAGTASLGRLETGVAEMLRQHARCHAVALWRRKGQGDSEELRSLGRLLRGTIGPAFVQPAPVSSTQLSAYLAWMQSAPYLTHDSAATGEQVVPQAWLLHCSAAVAFLHVPILHNGVLRGVVCFSDHAEHIDWSGPLRREIQQLISLVSIYVSPKGHGVNSHEGPR